LKAVEFLTQNLDLKLYHSPNSTQHQITFKSPEVWIKTGFVGSTQLKS